MKILSYDEVRERGVPYSKTQLWRLERDGKFPKRVRLGTMRHGWVDEEIDGYIAERIASRNGAAA